MRARCRVAHLCALLLLLSACPTNRAEIGLLSRTKSVSHSDGTEPAPHAQYQPVVQTQEPPQLPFAVNTAPETALFRGDTAIHGAQFGRPARVGAPAPFVDHPVGEAVDLSAVGAGLAAASGHRHARDPRREADLLE